MTAEAIELRLIERLESELRERAEELLQREARVQEREKTAAIYEEHLRGRAAALEEARQVTGDKALKEFERAIIRHERRAAERERNLRVLDQRIRERAGEVPALQDEIKMLKRDNARLAERVAQLTRWLEAQSDGDDDDDDDDDDDSNGDGNGTSSKK